MTDVPAHSFLPYALLAALSFILINPDPRFSEFTIRYQLKDNDGWIPLQGAPQPHAATEINTVCQDVLAFKRIVR